MILHRFRAGCDSPPVVISAGYNQAESAHERSISIDLQIWCKSRADGIVRMKEDESSTKAVCRAYTCFCYKPIFTQS